MSRVRSACIILVVEDKSVHTCVIWDWRWFAEAVCCAQASVEMMSPKSDAGLSSGPALPGFGAFGQPASGPSSTASGGAGTTAAFCASGPAFSAAPAFGAAGGAMFGSTDSRSGSAFAGALHS